MQGEGRKNAAISVAVLENGALPVNVRAMTNRQDENNNAFVDDLAEDAVISHAITPQAFHWAY